MLTILTKNPRKFEQFSNILEQLNIAIVHPSLEIPEIQTHDFKKSVSQKAFFAYQNFGLGHLVDDSGLILDAYPDFPGPITNIVCSRLGYQGMARLLDTSSNKAKMICYIGCWVNDKCWFWTGEVTGQLIPTKPPVDGQVPLNDWFLPDEKSEYGVFLHRKRALDSLVQDIEKLKTALLAGR